MVKDKKQKILLSALLVLAVFIWARALKGPPLAGIPERKGLGHTRKSGTGRQAGGVKRHARDDKGNREIYPDQGRFAPLTAAGPQRREKTKSAYPDWGRNPFVFEETPDGGTGKIILQGILIDEEDSRALINGHYVKKGDRVEEYVVVDIQQDKVILNDGTNDKELSLGE